ncbi:MAG: type II secretion system protein N [Thioalkalivibrionaceae bacterium]
MTTEFSTDDPSGRLNAIAARLASVVALAVVAWMSAGLVWQIASPDAAMSMGFANIDGDSAGTLPVVSDLDHESPRLAMIADRSLFGTANAPSVPAIAVVAPDSQLRVELTGIASIGSRGAAFVRVEGRAERLVRPGDALGVGNARVVAIESDRLVIDRDGRTEQIRLPRLDGRTPEAQIRPASAAPGASAAAGLELGSADGAPSVRRDEWLTSPERLTEAVQLRPVTRQGQFVGVSLRPLRNQREFAAAGLRPGDIVTAIDGMPVATIDDPGALLSRLSTASQVGLSIERDGAAIELSVNLE